MPSNRLAFAALAIACIGAAAGGGYLASKQNAVPGPASAQVQAPLPEAPTPVTTATALPATATAERPSQAVQETESVVADTASRTPASTAGSVSRTTVAKRAEPPARTGATREGRPVARQEQPPALTSSWPSSAATQAPAVPPTPTPAAADNTTPAQRPEERAAQETPRASEPPQKTFEELVVSSDSVIGLQTENRISSETARVEDRVEARVTRDVKVGDRVAIPAGSRAIGSVMQVERGGKFKERARLGIRFHTLVLADGTRLPISTETIYRDGGPRQWQRGQGRRRGSRRRDPRRDPRGREGRGNRWHGRCGRRDRGRHGRRSQRGDASGRHVDDRAHPLARDGDHGKITRGRVGRVVG